MSRLVLVPVPGTSSDGSPLVRVVVVPELDEATSVADTPLADWPALLRDASFEVEVVGPDGTARAVVPPSHDASSDTWRSLLAGLPVRSVGPPDIGPAPEVTRTAEQAAAVEQTYAAAANAPLDGAARPEAGERNLPETVAEQLAGWAEEPAPGAAPVTTRRSSNRSSNGSAEVDVHRVLTLLREHPAVLRALGLVFELPLTGELADHLGDGGTLSVRWPGKPADVPDPASPRAAYEVDEDRGLLPASSGLVVRGVMDLGDEQAFATTTLDVDGAVGRLQDAARGTGTARAEGAGAAVPTTLPALRSAGIVLLRQGHEDDQRRRRDRARAVNEAESLEVADALAAEDLMLGVRVDVRRRGTSSWTSLTRREATYLVDGQALPGPSEEEGHVKFGAAVRQDDDTLRADEVVARWTGWSLATPPGGLGRRTAGARTRADVPFDLDWDFTVPRGSLLPLRFGASYHVRARIADIAGGGVGPEDREAAHGTPAVTYVRHEPVLPPTVTLPAALDPTRLGPGGNPGHLVVRSDAPDYPRNDARVLAAPLTTLEIAEQHGALDGSDEATFAHVLTALDAGLPDPAAEGVTIVAVPAPGEATARTEQPGWNGEWPDAAAKSLVLQSVAQPVANPVRLDPAGDTVRVRLAPAQQITLALSSFLRDGFESHLAVHQWRTAARGDDDVVRSGRHPMASPPEVLTLVHAVRRPLATPSGSLEAAPREADATSVLLRPSLPVLGADTASTVQLQVAAAWTALDDDTATPVASVKVQDLAIDRGAERLGAELVHEVGDTRHHTVTYTVTAVSRFRHLYERDEDAALFTTAATLPAVTVLSTARPAPLAVRAVLPALASTEVVDGSVTRRVRPGGLLRVELERPWFLSGEGEQLGVVVERCELGRDPVWDTAPLPDRVPRAADFAGPSARVVHPEAGPVTVVGFDPVLVDGHWAADVAAPGLAAPSYGPFVRLALVRYQPHSIDDAHRASTVVRSDLVRVLPERTLTVDRSDPPAVVVTLTGPGPGPAVTPNRVDVVLETLVSPDLVSMSQTDLSLVDGDPGDVVLWTPVGTPVSGPLGSALSVSVPLMPMSGTRTRLRVREVEAALTEETAYAADGELAERVVFTDLIEL